MKKYYAIGDVHGQVEQLTVLLDAIATEIDKDDEIIFLGDLVDRGMHSYDVVHQVMHLEDRMGVKVTCLKGNHEQMFMMAYDSDEFYHWWAGNGGHQTVASYIDQLVPDDDVFLGSWRQAIPWDHRHWLKNLPLMYVSAEFIFVHAGLDPKYQWESPYQTMPEDQPACVWIREPFLSMEHDFGPRIVHGHTPGRLHHGKHRTSIDTGAVFHGNLTCGIFAERDAPTRFLMVDEHLDLTQVKLSPGDSVLRQQYD